MCGDKGWSVTHKLLVIFDNMRCARLASRINVAYFLWVIMQSDVVKLLHLCAHLLVIKGFIEVRLLNHKDKAHSLSFTIQYCSFSIQKSACCSQTVCGMS